VGALANKRIDPTAQAPYDVGSASGRSSCSKTLAVIFKLGVSTRDFIEGQRCFIGADPLYTPRTGGTTVDS